MTMLRKNVEVIGPRSLPGHYLLDLLSESGFVGRQLGRTHTAGLNSSIEQFPWTYLDALDPKEWLPEENAAVISLLPLWLLPPLLPRLNQCRQLIAFGSTSVFTKLESRDVDEREVAGKLAEAEESIIATCSAKGIPWTILRPTLVYDEGRDQNVSAIARFIKRWGVFPLVTPGQGLRQPVHAQDLALAALQALDNPLTFNRSFNLSGGETLTYRQMVERIFKSLGRTPRILPVPLALAETPFRMFKRLRKTAHSPALFRRMNQDLCFDSSDARSAMGYDPRPFNPDFAKSCPRL